MNFSYHLLDAGLGVVRRPTRLLVLAARKNIIGWLMRSTLKELVDFPCESFFWYVHDAFDHFSSLVDHFDIYRVVFPDVTCGILIFNFLCTSICVVHYSIGILFYVSITQFFFSISVLLFYIII